MNPSPTTCMLTRVLALKPMVRDGPVIPSIYDSYIYRYATPTKQYNKLENDRSTPPLYLLSVPLRSLIHTCKRENHYEDTEP